MAPVLCLITDRRRLGTAWRTLLVDRVAAAAREGVHLIQLRERDLDGRPLLHLTVECVAAVRGTRTRVVVNDRLDVALAAGAHGVHLRADSFDAAAVRRIAPRPFVVGRSIHSVEEAVAADGETLDYLIFGTTFETSSKPGRPAAGLKRLSDAAAATAVPVLAVGGVTRERLGDVIAAGASGGAGISLFDTPGHLT